MLGRIGDGKYFLVCRATQELHPKPFIKHGCHHCNCTWIRVRPSRCYFSVSPSNTHCHRFNFIYVLQSALKYLSRCCSMKTRYGAHNIILFLLRYFFMHILRSIEDHMRITNNHHAHWKIAGSGHLRLGS